VQELKRGKRDGFSGLMSDHVINTCDELFIHISYLLSSVLVHGTPSDDLLVSTILPIPNGKTGNRTASSNYRAIALSSIFGKIFDHNHNHKHICKAPLVDMLTLSRLHTYNLVLRKVIRLPCVHLLSKRLLNIIAYCSSK